MAFHSRVLVTGSEGFTGIHLRKLLGESGFECFGLDCDLLDRDGVSAQVAKLRPSYVIHLAGVSFAAEQDIASVYSVNVVGTLNLLDALQRLKYPLKKVVLASSATVYGNVEGVKLAESMRPQPVNHYGCSKLSMEYMAANYFDSMSIIITRPFNYTGVHHNKKFLIPKILDAYKKKQATLELGNLDVSREFNDVRDVANIYRLLLSSAFNSGVVNVCSGKPISLSKVISLMDEICREKMHVITNPEFVRDNEIKCLSGDPHNLERLIDFQFQYTLEDTLRWMIGSWRA